MKYMTSHLFCALLSGTLILLSGCGKSEPPSQTAKLPTASIRVEQVQSRSYQQKDEVAGTVRSKLKAMIEAKVSGRIKTISAQVGQEVAQMDPLIELDAQEISSRYDQAVTAREQALSEWRRYEALRKDEVITQQEYEQVESRYRIADSQALEAKTMLGYTVINAPFTGIVTRKLADVGDLASPGKPLLELEDPLALRLEADIPEGLLDRIHLGDQLDVQISSITNRLTGTVSEIAPVGDPNSRTFPVKLDLQSQPGLRSGQFGRVSVPIGLAQSLFIPSGAIVQRGQLDLVFVVKDGKALLRIVKTGKQMDGQIEILAGLEAGEWIATQNASLLSNGQPVEVLQ